MLTGKKTSKISIVSCQAPPRTFTRNGQISKKNVVVMLSTQRTVNRWDFNNWQLPNPKNKDQKNHSNFMLNKIHSHLYVFLALLNKRCYPRYQD
jgi:hypothetical protein